MGGSLAEELSNALDGVELPSGETAAPETTETAAPAEIAPAPGEETAQPTPEQSADGQQVAHPAQEQAGQQPGEQEQGQAQDSRINAPPATWSAAAKAIYSQLPEVARREIAKREQDYARGIQQHAEKARGFDTLMSEAQPYQAMLRSEGADVQSALRSFLTQAYTLRTANPQERGRLIMEVAQRYGADLTPYLGQQGQQAPEGQNQDQFQGLREYINQLVNPVLQKVNTFEQQRMTAEQREQQAMEQDVTSQIEAFQNATDANGTPKHLYFENVRGLMASYFNSGQAQTMEQAYEMACWAHPEVRAALIADQQRAADAKRLDEAKRKASDAKTAGFNVSGQGGVGIAGANQSSLRDELSQQLDAALGSGRV